MTKRRKEPSVEPSDLELQILTLLWQRGPSTAREVLGELPDGKQRAYTTVLSVMQVMEKKGLVEVADRRGLAHVYRPLVSRSKVLGPMMRRMVGRVFGGSPADAVAHLLDASAVDADELDAIARLIDEARKQQKGDR